MNKISMNSCVTPAPRPDSACETEAGTLKRRSGAALIPTLGSLCLAFTLAGCTSNPAPPGAAASASHGSQAPTERSAASTAASAPTTSSVQIHGSVHAIMMQGRTQARVALSAATAPHVFGLGALANLNGEVTIWDGEAWLARPNGEEARVESTPTPEGDATLLATATVSQWQRHTVPGVLPQAKIAELIARRVKASGAPTPFLIEGQVSRLAWHVIDGKRITDASHTGMHGHAAHVAASVRGVLSDTSVRVVGFYSTRHHGVLTHHDSDLHMHVVAENERVTGHVDEIALAPGAVLSLPKR